MFRDDDRGWVPPRRFHVLSRCGNALLGPLGYLGGVVGGSIFLYPLLLSFPLLGESDERAARRLRHALGLRQCLVSWELQCDGMWKARLSGPGLAFTIERTAKGRCRAILRAERAMNRILGCRSVIRKKQPPTGDFASD